MDRAQEVESCRSLKAAHTAMVSLQHGLCGPAGVLPIGAPNVMLVAYQLLTEAASRLPGLRPLTAAVTDAIAAVASGLRYVPPEFLTGLGSRLQSAFPAWRLMLDRSKLTFPEVRRLAAAELVRSLLHVKASRDLKSVKSFRYGRRLLDVHKLQGEDLKAELKQLDKLSQRIESDLAAVSDCSEPTLRAYAFRNDLAAHLQGLLNPQSTVIRQQRSSKMLEPEEVSVVAKALRQAAVSGDDLALALVISFCCPLLLGMTVDLPLFGKEDGDWIAVLDLSAGAVSVDLSSTILHRAAGNAFSEVATAIYRFYLPGFATRRLRELNQAHPQAITLGDLLGMASPPSSRTKLNYGGLSNPPRISTFLNSKSVICKQAALDRSDAAFTVGDLGQIGKSLHHYLTLLPANFQRAAAKVHAQIGWTDDDAQVQEATQQSEIVPATGSQSTPTSAAVVAVDMCFQSSLRAAEAGPNAGWSKLVRHHNAYVLAVAHRAAFFLAARRKNNFCLFADTVNAKYALAFHVDKRTGPLAGLAPVVMTPHFQRQLDLYRAHLDALVRRAARRAPLEVVDALSRRLQQIGDEQHVNHLFQIRDQELVDFGMRELATVHPQIELDGDFRRHFMATAGVRHGLSTEEVEFLLRHFVDGYSPIDSLSTKSVHAMALRVGDFVDAQMRDLNMIPLCGLSRTITRGSCDA